MNEKKKEKKPIPKPRGSLHSSKIITRDDDTTRGKRRFAGLDFDSASLTADEREYTHPTSEGHSENNHKPLDTKGSRWHKNHKPTKKLW